MVLHKEVLYSLSYVRDVLVRMTFLSRSRSSLEEKNIELLASLRVSPFFLLFPSLEGVMKKEVVSKCMHEEDGSLARSDLSSSSSSSFLHF